MISPNLRRALIVSVFLVLGAAVFLYNSGQNDIKEIEVHADYINFENLQKLDEFSQLVVVATPIKDFNDRVQKTEYFPDGSMMDFYSLTNVKIEKVIKAPNDFDRSISNLDIVEPVSLVTNGSGLKKLKREGYTELKKGNTYIIYLTKGGKNYYSVNGFNGRINIGDTDPDDEGKGEEKELKKAFKKEAQTKYPELFKK